MDLLSPIVFVGVIAIVGLVAVGIMVMREARTQGRLAPVRRVDHTQPDSSAECGDRVVHRRRLSKWDYIRTP